jgi:GGDEF domain-containing protein
LAQTIIAQLERPFHMGSYNLQTSTSIGIALFPLNGQNKMELLKHADAAMYKAKSLGRGRYCFYTDDLNAGILQL